MPAHNLDLHGNAPDSCPVVLLLIDLINDFDYPGGDKLLAYTRDLVEPVLAIRQRAHELGIL